MQLHEKIKFIRNMKGWSQEEVAHRLGMSISGYGCIERGETDIPFSRLLYLAKVFEIDLLELLSVNEKNVFNLAGTNNNQSNWHVNSSDSVEVIKLRAEVEKLNMFLEQQTKEILYLKEIIELLKQTHSTRPNS
jgi:transcriptional regulator with XRE-family HTH domain